MTHLYRNITILIVVLVLAVVSTSGFSMQGGLRQGLDVAHSGYDMVSYFTEGKAEQGNSEFTTIYKDAVYQFTSGAHQVLFLKEPEKYLPQFDGYCAYGVTFTQKLKADPTVWKIVDGKLYFNLSQKFMKDWSKDLVASIQKGHEEWELIKDVPPEEL